ncbi:MAG: extracellular solute-binding protein [Armatimonadetes bacterium]|nr:extracellular solute-binding protein [Armatimonadota bacterium]
MIRFGVLSRIVSIFLVFLVVVGARAAEPVELRFTVWDGDQALIALREAVNEFERKYPDIKIKMENVSYGSYFQKLLAQYAANVAPDVSMMDPPNFQRFAKRGAFLPLNQFFDQVPGFNINDYYKQIVDAHSYHGQLYVLPRDIAPIGLVYYNKKMFDDAGIPYPDGSWTWDFKERPELKEKDFMWVLHQLTKKNAKGKPTQYGMVVGWPGLLRDLFVFSQGARYTNGEEDFTKLTYDDPRVVNAVQYVGDILNKDRYIPSPSEMSNSLQSSATQVFNSKKAAMYMCGIWEVPNIREVVKPGSKEFFDWDLTLAPAYKDGTAKMSTGGSGYGILSSTKHPKEAWLFTTWMAGEQGMMAMAKKGLAQPAIRKYALREPWIPGPNTPLDQQYPKNRIATDQAVDRVVFFSTSEYWTELGGLVDAQCERVYLGTATAKEAIAEGMRRANIRLQAIQQQGGLSKFSWMSGLWVALAVLVGAIAWVYWPERKIRRTRSEKAESRAGYMFIAPWIIGMIVFTLGPMVLSFLMSFAEWDIIMPARWRGGGNYAEAVGTDPRFWGSLYVTMVYTLVSVPFGLLGSMLLALLLNVKVKGMPLYRTCFYLPSLASAVAASLVWRKIFAQDGGLLNLVIYGPHGDGNFLGLASALKGLAAPGQMINWLGREETSLLSMIIMSLWGIGGGMVILLAGLQGIPQMYYEAATLDGAGPWRKFVKVTFPLLTPSLFFSLITGVIGSFQVFTQAFVMTQGGPNDSTRFYMYHLYDNAFGGLRMGYASALAWILFFIILIFTLVQWKLNKYVYYESDTR